MGFVQIVSHWLVWAYFVSEWVIRLDMLAVVPVRRTPAAAKGWLLLIFFQPWIGLLLYALIGRPKIPRWRVEQMKKLAGAGQGLATYISKFVQDNYALKLA